MEKKTIILDDLILERILDLASMMLTAGGEVSRVENTIRILASAYGAAAADVFTITSSMVVTVRFSDRESITQTRRIGAQNTDMSLLSALNSLSREICAELKTANEFSVALSAIKSKKPNNLVFALCWALASGSFCFFFGGSVVDSIISTVIGIVLFCFKLLFSKVVNNNYLVIILCSILGGILASVPTLFIENVSPFFISIGNIMLLIPGIALVTSVRDMFSGDTISGLLRSVEAIMVSLFIAWGFANFSLGSVINDSASYALQLATAFTGSIGFAFVFNSKLKEGMVAAVGGFLGWAAVISTALLTDNEFICYLCGSILITLFAEVLARLLRSPATVFIVIGLIPMIPGKSLYSTMRYLIDNDWQSFATTGLNTLMYAISISAGVVLVTALFNKKRR